MKVAHDLAAGLDAPATQAHRHPLVVFKFGSSVLRTSDDLPDVVTEIYRAVRTGRRVVAVVSAFGGVTEALLAETRARGCAHDNVNAPAYVAIGEESAATLTALACDTAGLNAIAFKTPELGLTARGCFEEATPVALNDRAIRDALDAHDVVVVPGFVATDDAGRTVLLGRGGSDLTAVYLAHALGAERVRLVKGVDGVYDADPAEKRDALRFEHVDWAHAAQIAGRLVQPRALEFAKREGVTIEVGRLGSDVATIVGRASAPPSNPPPRRKLRIALAGCGVVGAGVAQRLLRQPDAFEIATVLVREPSRERGVVLPRGALTNDVAQFAEAEFDVLVDVLSCASLGARLSEMALTRGRDVVSANKQAIVLAYDKLDAARGANGALLLHSAAVGGGAPLLEAAQAAVASGANVETLEGVLNGTVNFVLELLSAGVDLDQALARAREAGLAEEDASSDLDGRDAAAKLELLSRAAFGKAPDEVTIARLDAVCARRASETRLKQVARLQKRAGAVSGEIVFEHATQGPFSGVRADRNAVRLVADNGLTWRAGGRGAGRWPTTESVFADLIDLSARACRHGNRSAAE